MISKNRNRRNQPNKKQREPRSKSIDQLTQLRAIACQVVHNVVVKQQSLNTLLPLANEQIAEKDHALLQELVFGCCRWYFHLDDIQNEFLDKPLHHNDKLAETLLKIGTYQLLYMRIPNHAALNETVEATQELGLHSLKGLINAILRKVSQLKQNTDQQAAIDSHPSWMQDKIRNNWPENWQDILQQNNQHPPMTLRVNKQFTGQQIDTSGYSKLLEGADIKAEPCQFAPFGLSLETPCQVSRLPFFAEGAVSVQDEAAQLCCELLDLKPNLKVLDACAAPGGKTCAMLETEPSLQVLALDLDETRARLIADNLSRLNLSATIKTAPAEEPEQWWDGEPFDRILLDAPCSATGVIRRHPDIKLLRQEGDIKQLAELQLKMLCRLWPTLKPGGKLLYATCSIFPQENSRIIARFLKQEISAKNVEISADWGLETGFGRQLFPRDHGHDGFFYACLEKTIV
jgi:16S rRNA (cytosine967-C5)-methyltransferase